MKYIYIYIYICALTDLGAEDLMKKITTTAPFEWLKDENNDACVGLFRDDGIGLVVGLNQEDTPTVQEWFNKLHPTLKFEVKLCTQAEFLDILVSIEDRKIITKPYSKPSASHKYLSPNSCHDKSVISAIPFGVFYRLKILSSSNQIFEEAANEYSTYLSRSGYSTQLINEKLNAVRALNRTSMLEDNEDKNQKQKPVAVLVLDGHPAIPSGKKAISKAKEILQLDKTANRMIKNKCSLISAVRRLPYISETLGTSKDPSQLLQNKKETKGYSGCKKCDLCKWSKFATYITNEATGMKYKLKKDLSCKSKFVIYAYICSMDDCENKIYVGRADDMKKRHSNHKSHIKNKYSSCKLTEHMISVHNGNITQKSWKIQIIDSIEDLQPPQNCTDIKTWRYEKLEQLEEYYRTLLCSYVPHGLNVRGESKYKKWQKIGNVSSQQDPDYVEAVQQPGH